MYPAQMVLPLKEELTSRGFTSLETVSAVDESLSKQGTTLLVINSVCGCSAGTARPGALMSLQGDKKPDYITTTFAGFDIEAVQQARKHMLPYPPSSPCIALFKNGQLVHMIERHMIEGRPAQMIAANLMEAYKQHC